MWHFVLFYLIMTYLLFACTCINCTHTHVLTVRTHMRLRFQVADVVLSMAMHGDGSVRKRLVIMDEVDGMGGSDRGGIPELIKVRCYMLRTMRQYTKL